MSRNSPEKPQKPLSPADRRAERLAQALRANLQRRKAGDRPEPANPPGKSAADEE